MDTLTFRVENHQDAPIVRKRETADDRRKPRHVPTAAIDHQPAAGKKSDADARTRSTPKPQRITFDVERQIVEPAQPCGYRKRDLRAGTQTDMSGNDFRHFYPVAAIKREQSLHFL